MARVLEDGSGAPSSRYRKEVPMPALISSVSTLSAHRLVAHPSRVAVLPSSYPTCKIEIPEPTRGLEPRTC